MDDIKKDFINNDIYNMLLHEKLKISKDGDISILRVEGGWIYEFKNYSENNFSCNHIFVEFRTDLYSRCSECKNLKDNDCKLGDKIKRICQLNHNNYFDKTKE